MKFTYYVLNYNHNKKVVEPFNIFDNYWVQEQTEKEIKKYLRSPKNYKYIPIFSKEEHCGFEALCKRIEVIIATEERARYEYEMCCGYKFTPEIKDLLRYIDEYNSVEELTEELIELDKSSAPLKAFDCYDQAKMNIEALVRECLFQYKESKKTKKKEGD